MIDFIFGIDSFFKRLKLVIYAVILIFLKLPCVPVLIMVRVYGKIILNV